jgi:small Trp-rich protein
MWFVLLGVILMLLHWTGIQPMASWNWKPTEDLWKFLWPFGAALIWWAWADFSGYTKRKAVEKMEKKKGLRREKNLSALGLGIKARGSKKSNK